MDADIALALARRGGIVRARDHRERRHLLYAAAERGELVIIHPGVFVLPAGLSDPVVRIRAAAAWRPEAVVVGRAAARLTFWPDLPVDAIDLAVPTRQRDRPGIRFHRRAVPHEWRWSWRGMTLTRPAMTVVDLLPSLGGGVVSTALHRGVGYDRMVAALHAVPGRRGLVERRDVLRRYRDEPWSEAEQVAHQLLREARVPGWIANYPIRIDGRLRFLDLAFEAQRVAIEIDGYEFHGHRPETRERFESDRFIASTLVGHGWRVLRFTYRQLVDASAWVVACIRAALHESDICAGRRAYRADFGDLPSLTGADVG